MKTRNEKVTFRSRGFYLILVSLVVFSTGVSHCQDKSGLTFKGCENYKDSCLYIGKAFMQNLSDQNFENLVHVFSDNVFFRALIPSSIVTLNDPFKTADKLKSWFYNEEPEKFEIIESSSEILVDCLHISYMVFITYKGNPYNVEQHLYCEVEEGKIYKLSLICSGFRRLN